jgi:hypothetical protein
MAIDTGGTIDKVQHLDDLELALLLSIVANEHCLVEAIPEDLDATEQRIKQVSGTLPWAEPRAESSRSQLVSLDSQLLASIARKI